jgi:hypothetical protein
MVERRSLALKEGEVNVENDVGFGVYEGVYDGVYEGVYDGVYEGVYDGVYEGGGGIELELRGAVFGVVSLVALLADMAYDCG